MALAGPHSLDDTPTMHDLRRFALPPIGLLTALLLAGGCQQRQEPVPTPTQDQWRRIQEAMLDEAPTVAFPVDAVFGENVRLIGWDIEPEQLEVGATFRLRLYWEVLQPPRERWHIFVHLDGDGRQNLDHEAIGNGYPSIRWKAGQIFVDEVRGELDPRVGNGTIRLYTGLFRDDQRLPVQRTGEGVVEADGRLRIGTIESTWRPEEYRVRRATGTMDLDGALEEATWRRAQQTDRWGTLTQGEAADVESWAKILWDDQALHIGLQFEDADLRASADTLSPNDDAVDVYIEPWEGAETILHVRVNAAGAFETRTLSTATGAVLSPPTVVRALPSAVAAVDRDGTLSDDSPDTRWSVELRVPWEALPDHARVVPITNTTAIRLNLVRTDARDSEDAVLAWSAIGSHAVHDPTRFGVLQFTGAPRRPVRAEPAVDAPATGEASAEGSASSP
jgi:hypothetical protein